MEQSCCSMRGQLLLGEEEVVEEEVHNLEEVGEVAHITASDIHTSPITV